MPPGWVAVLASTRFASETHQVARDVLEAVHAVADRVLPPENARAMLLGVAAVMIAENMADKEPDAATINATWAERGFPWRMTRVQQTSPPAVSFR
jgi:hypothetical protein